MLSIGMAHFLVGVTFSAGFDRPGALSVGAAFWGFGVLD